MGDTSETNTKVLSRELFLGVVALKRLYRKSLFARQGPYSQVRSHIYIYIYGQTRLHYPARLHARVNIITSDELPQGHDITYNLNNFDNSPVIIHSFLY